MLNDDIVLAQKIVSRVQFNFGNNSMFHNTSAIYKVSNECIPLYHKYLVDKKKMLSVIASGDQILNAILEGTVNIDAFDISTFPKYFLFLKIGAIKALSRVEYVDFFYGLCNTSEVYDEMYDKISEYLDSDIKMFWDSLINFFDWQEIYDSTLFSSEPYSVGNAISQNKYLSNDLEYNKLKSVINKVSIRTYEGDILKLATQFRDSYDLVYLSNIVYYVDRKRYKEILKNFKLEKNGVVLSYFYGIDKNVTDFFQDECIEFDKFANKNAGVMLYHR